MKSITLFSLAFNVVLIALLGFGAYQFIVKGSVSVGPDGRTAILLTRAERAHVLGEMRGLVATLQSITQALAAHDLKSVETLARAAGMGRTQGETPSFMGKLPLEFKKLGFGLHKKFDLLAETTATKPQEGVVLSQLSDLMLNCVTCHEAYLIEATD